MKKTYSKPQVVFDSFEMADNIAACASDARHNQGECAADLGGFYVFMTGISGCQYTVENDGDYGLCYYVPSADNSLFGS